MATIDIHSHARKGGVFVNLHMNTARTAKEGWMSVADGMKAVSEIAHEGARHAHSHLGSQAQERHTLDLPAAQGHGRNHDKVLFQAHRLEGRFRKEVFDHRTQVGALACKQAEELGPPQRQARGLQTLGHGADAGSRAPYGGGRGAMS